MNSPPVRRKLECIAGSPMTQLAIELGISDWGWPRCVAGTRCGRRRGDGGPTSGRARPEQVPLPAPELDAVVQFEASDPLERERPNRLKPSAPRRWNQTLSVVKPLPCHITADSDRSSASAPVSACAATTSSIRCWRIRRTSDGG
jgi:hypothetical protein